LYLIRGPGFTLGIISCKYVEKTRSIFGKSSALRREEDMTDIVTVLLYSLHMITRAKEFSFALQISLSAHKSPLRHAEKKESVFGF
jgi:hypothetical protein